MNFCFEDHNESHAGWYKLHVVIRKGNILDEKKWKTERLRIFV
jgi:hypothetical protein